MIASSVSILRQAFACACFVLCPITLALHPQAVYGKPASDSKNYAEICPPSAGGRGEPPPGPSVLRPGHYFDPRRAGQGWSFHWYGGTNDADAGDKLFAQWFTFEVQSGSSAIVQPVWFGAVSTVDSWSETGEVSNGNRLTWVGKLYRFKQVHGGATSADIFRQWAPAIEHGTALPGVEAEHVGDVEFFFGVSSNGQGGLSAGGQPNQLAARWSLRARAGFEVAMGQFTDCMTNFVTEVHARYPEPQTGVFQERNASGVFWNPLLWREGSQSSPDILEHHGLAYFDRQGNPRWLVGGPRVPTDPNDPTPIVPKCTGAEPEWVTRAFNNTSYVRLCMMVIQGYKPWLREGETGYGWTRVEMAALGRSPWTAGSHLSDFETSIKLVTPDAQSGISMFGTPDITSETGARVRKTVGLTRAILNSLDSISLSEAACIASSRPSNHGGIVGVCRLVAHWMTEDWLPNLTVTLTRTNRSPGSAAPASAMDEYDVIETGRIRSSVGGRPIPDIANPNATGPIASGAVVGDRVRIDVFDSPTRTRRVFSGRELTISPDPSAGSLCASERALTDPPTVTFEAPNGVLRTKASISAAIPNRSPTGFRFSLYRAENGVAHSFVGNRMFYLGPNVQPPFEATVEWPRLPSGRKYFARVDAFNECNQTNSPMSPPTPFELLEPVVADAAYSPLTAPAQDPVPVGVTAGEGSVSGGAATFSVPIAVPPGRKGMQPDVSLVYSSRSGNGIAGMGWSLSAGRSIHRCPRTVAQDGESRPVDFGPNDRLCLDGERLVLVNGTYGAAGAEYRTEVDSFARIRQTGSLTAPSAAAVGTAPHVFEVDHKSGVVERFGGNGVTGANNATVVVISHGTGNARHALSWQLAERVDRSGNNIAYGYTNIDVDGLTDEHLLTEIAYTGHQGKRGDRKVQFGYLARPNAVDWATSFIGGASQVSRRRLATITTVVDKQTVRQYSLGYDAASPVTGRSVLRTLTECAFDATGANPRCRLPVLLEWSGGTAAAPNFVHAPLPIAAALLGDPVPVAAGEQTRAPPTLSMRAVGDLDGDGTIEQVLTRVTPAEPSTAAAPPKVVRHVIKLAADRRIVAAVELPSSWAADLLLDVADPVDLDNDGRTELVGVFGPGAPGTAAPRNGCELQGTCRTVALRWNGTTLDWTGRSFAEVFQLVNLTLSTLEPSNIAGSRIAVHTARQYQAGNLQNPVTLMTGDEQMYFADVTQDGLPDLIIVRTPTGLTDPNWGNNGNWPRVTHASSCGSDGRGGYGPVLFVYRNTTQRGRSVRFDETPIYGRCMAGARLLDNQRHVYDRIQNLMDVDGGGLPDLFIYGHPGEGPNPRPRKPRVLFGITAAPNTFAFGSNDDNTSVDQIEIDELGTGSDMDYASEGEPRWADVNGDGLADAVHVLNCSNTGGPSGPHTVVRLNLGARNRISSNDVGLLGPRSVVDAPDGGPNASCTNNFVNDRPRFNVFADIDADGRDEFLRPVGFAVRRCTLIREGKPGELPPATSLAYHCPEPPVGEWSPIDLIEGKPPTEIIKRMYLNNTQAWDQSLYLAQATRIVQTGTRLSTSGSTTLARPVFVSQPIGRQIVTDAVGSRFIDQYGDGLTDSLFSVRCPLTYEALTTPVCPRVLGSSPLSATLSANGLYISENVGAGSQRGREPLLPDLMTRAVKQGRFANANVDLQSWTFDYAPLSSAAGRSPTALKLYELPTSQSVDSSHLYFTSSMPVVSEMRVTAGATRFLGGRPTSGQHIHTFAYREALYDRSGRGFRGFRAIVEEVDAVSANGLAVIPGTRTVTRFHQDFPLTSAVECSMSSSSARAIGTLQCASSVVPGTGSHAGTFLTSWSGFAYDIVPKAGVEARYFDVRATGQRSRSFKPEVTAPDLIVDSIVSSPSDAYDDYGNVTQQTVSSTEHLDSVRRIVRTTTTNTNYLPADEAAWFIDRISSRVTTSELSTIGVAGAPVGAGATTKRVTQLYSHDFLKSGGGVGTRQVNCIATIDGTVPKSSLSQCESAESLSSWSNTVTSLFDSYGNAASVTRRFRRTTGTATVDEVPAPAQRTEITSFGAGYFPVATYNAKQHGTCIDTDPRFGLVSQSRRLMHVAQSCSNPADGLVEKIEFDPFGLEIKRTYPSAVNASNVTMAEAPPGYIGRNWCISASNCPSHFGTAVWRETRTQRGSPDSIRYFDAQNRIVGERSDSLSGWVDTVRMYDDLGRPVFESVPEFSAAAASRPSPESLEFDGALLQRHGVHRRFDIFGRERIKIQVRNRLDDESGAQALLTRYTPDRLGTALTVRNCTGVSKLSSGEVPLFECIGQHGIVLSMSRAMDGGGRPIEVVDALAGSSRYWYDALGNVIALQDPNGNAITASYDNLGRRTASTDPNQGTHSFEYNGLGELVLSRDGRGWRAAYVRDVLGRIASRRWAEPMGAIQPAVQQYGEDLWAYDSLGYGLTTSEQRRLYRDSSPTTVYERFERTFEYADPLYRLTATTSRALLPDGSTDTLTRRQHWDANYGRIKQTSWPQLASVAYRYAASGHLQDTYEVGTPSTSYLTRTVSVNPTGTAMQSRMADGTQLRCVTEDPSTGMVTAIESGVATSGAACGQIANPALKLSYRYDGFGNLARTQNASVPSGGSASPLIETFEYDELHRLRRTEVPRQSLAITYAYHANGNFKHKSDYTTPTENAYVYGTGNTAGVVDAGPNAVTEVSVPTPAGCKDQFWYDDNGNLNARASGVCNGRRTGAEWIDYNIDNLPKGISTIASGVNLPLLPGQIPTVGTLQSHFRYGPDGQRYFQRMQPGTAIRDTRYDGPYERDRITGNGAGIDGYTEHRLTVTPGVVMTIRESSTGFAEPVFHYVHTDRLGSANVVVRGNGTIANSDSFGPFGEPRAANGLPTGVLHPTAGDADFRYPPAMRRGFTDHEHLDRHALIHMNGRMYDYRLGRFLGVDPIVQFPTNSQSLNPYSYILNNPLSGTDPTGYCAAEAGTRIKSCVKLKLTYSSGRTITESFNLRSAHDIQRAFNMGIVITQNGSTGGIGFKTFNDVSSVEVGALSKQRANGMSADIQVGEARSWEPSFGFLRPSDEVASLAPELSVYTAMLDGAGDTYAAWRAYFGEGEGYTNPFSGRWVGGTDAWDQRFLSLVGAGAGRAMTATPRWMPTMDYRRSELPAIADNIEKAIADGQPSVLTRLTDRRAIDRNRRNALRGRAPAGHGYSRDEYPFASSYQGGRGARVADVPGWQNDQQGFMMREFYRNYAIADGDSYRVRVID